MFEVITLGECMAVLYPTEPIPLDRAATLALDIAGAEANLAIGLSRLGHRVQFLGRVGADPFGQRIRLRLQAEGVDTSSLLTDIEAPTGVFFREWLPDGARRVFYYRRHSAASHLAPQDIAPETFAGVRVVHLTGITPALGASCAATVEHVIELAHAAGALVSFDPNYRAKLWDIETARKTLLPMMERADMLLIGHEDAEALFGIDAEAEGSRFEEDILQRGVAFGAQIVVLKRAERGVCARAGGAYSEIPAEIVSPVVDPVGAGDGFNAGFLSGWLRGASLESSLRLGARIGAAAVATLGDYAGYPRLEAR